MSDFLKVFSFDSAQPRTVYNFMLQYIDSKKPKMNTPSIPYSSPLVAATAAGNLLAKRPDIDSVTIRRIAKQSRG